MKIEKVLITTILILLIFTNISNFVYASDVLTNPGAYNPGGSVIPNNGDREIEQMTSKILTILSNIGVVVSIVSTAIIGIKYIIGSVEERAKYKENIFPYIVGIVLLFGISMIIKALESIGNRLNTI